jgi:acetyl-CoA carboxylase carboxyl transferase subunit alpha
MHQFGLIDTIIPEPVGGAHWNYDEAASLLKPYLINTIKELKQLSPEERTRQRIEKFGKMGFYDEVRE